MYRNPRHLRRDQNTKQHKEEIQETRGVRHSPPLLGDLCLRRHNLSAKPPPHRHRPRPRDPHRQLHHRRQARRPGRCRMENPPHKAHTQPQRREGLLQRVQLQQVPALAAHRLRQDRVRGRGHRRTP